MKKQYIYINKKRSTSYFWYSNNYLILKNRRFIESLYSKTFFWMFDIIYLLHLVVYLNYVMACHCVEFDYIIQGSSKVWNPTQHMFSFKHVSLFLIDCVLLCFAMIWFRLCSVSYRTSSTHRSQVYDVCSCLQSSYVKGYSHNDCLGAEYLTISDISTPSDRRRGYVS